MSDGNDNERFRESTYEGVRLEGRKLVHSFRDVEGVGFHYPKAKASTFAGAIIGKKYDLRGKLPRFWQTVQVGEVDDEQRALFQGRSREARLAKDQYNVEASPDIERALKTLRVARAGVSFARKTAFDVWVVNQIHKQP